MRRAVLAGAGALALCRAAVAEPDLSLDVTARGFGPRFDAFAAAHLDNPHFAAPPPLRPRDCEDPRPGEPTTCHYTFARTVDVEAETEPGSERLARVTLTWNGADGRRDLFAEAAGWTYGTLSPGGAGPAWGDVAWAVLADLPRPPYTFELRAWQAGSWSYRLWHDGRYGARDTVLFQATRATP